MGPHLASARRAVIGAALAGSVALSAGIQLTPNVPPPVGEPEAARLSEIWALLAQDKAGDAATASSRLLTQAERSPSTLDATIESVLATAGSLSALSTYERWLGARTVESPYLLRDIARMRLREIAFRTQDPSTEDALAALYRDADPIGLAAVTQAARKGQLSDVRMMAAAGDASAVSALIKALDVAGTGNKTREIAALAQSGSRAAVPVLTKLLGDGQPQNRVAALTALGHIDGAASIDRIKPLLADQTAFVRQTAASVLYSLNDTSGLNQLQELAASPEPAIRLGAAQLLASHPDAQWQNLVRQLIQSPTPEVRLGAAQLIAPYDPALAATALSGLERDANPAIRDEARRALPAALGNDFAALRRLLRASDPLTVVTAADRILITTR